MKGGEDEVKEDKNEVEKSMSEKKKRELDVEKAGEIMQTLFTAYPTSMIELCRLSVVDYVGLDQSPEKAPLDRKKDAKATSRSESNQAATSEGSPERASFERRESSEAASDDQIKDGAQSDKDQKDRSLGLRQQAETSLKDEKDKEGWQRLFFRILESMFLMEKEGEVKTEQVAKRETP